MAQSLRVTPYHVDILFCFFISHFTKTPTGKGLCIALRTGVQEYKVPFSAFSPTGSGVACLTARGLSTSARLSLSTVLVSYPLPLVAWALVLVFVPLSPCPKRVAPRPLLRSLARPIFFFFCWDWGSSQLTTASRLGHENPRVSS